MNKLKNYNKLNSLYFSMFFLFQSKLNKIFYKFIFFKVCAYFKKYSS